MAGLHIEAWSALAPGLETKKDWSDWLDDPKNLGDSISKKLLKPIAPMLRRRFSSLGKCAVSAALQIVKEGETIPSVFSSRYGDSALTLTLLEDMGKNEPMSPTSFSLAVHNAVSGLFSIARKDTSAVTSIASITGLVMPSLLESIGQLEDSERVLCVIYDTSLPEPYRRYCESNDFPYAIAIIFSRKKGEYFNIEQCEHATQNADVVPSVEPLDFIRLLMGVATEMVAELNGVTWRITKISSNDRK